MIGTQGLAFLFDAARGTFVKDVPCVVPNDTHA
jgi:hypothetical protein